MNAQDDVSYPGAPFAVGLTLEALSAHTVDESGKEAFVTQNPVNLLRKVNSQQVTCVSVLDWRVWRDLTDPGLPDSKDLQACGSDSDLCQSAAKMRYVGSVANPARHGTVIFE